MTAVDLRTSLDRPASVPFRYNPALDGTRGLGILIVVFGHYSAGMSLWAQERFFGVSLTIDLFFVLSGYLITALLLEEWSKTGQISMRKFYARRGLRLLPALYLLLAFVTFAALFTDWLPVSTKLALAEVAAAALYVYPIILATKGEGAFLLHLWTLSVEEWFYFIWPGILLLIGLKPGTATRFRIVVAGLIAICVGMLALRVVGAEDPLSDLMLRLRPDSLAYGALLAIGMRKINDIRTPAIDKVLSIMGPLGVLAFIYFDFFAIYPSSESGDYEHFQLQSFGSLTYQMGIWSCFLLIMHIVNKPAGGVSKVLSWRPLIYLGILSYAVYLWHQPLFLILNDKVFHANPHAPDLVERTVGEMWAFGLAVLLLTLVVAFISRHLVELPALRLKKRFEPVQYAGKR